MKLIERARAGSGFNTGGHGSGLAGFFDPILPLGGVEYLTPSTIKEGVGFYEWVHLRRLSLKKSVICSIIISFLLLGCRNHPHSSRVSWLTVKQRQCEDFRWGKSPLKPFHVFMWETKGETRPAAFRGINALICAVTHKKKKVPSLTCMQPHWGLSSQ